MGQLVTLMERVDGNHNVDPYRPRNIMLSTIDKAPSSYRTDGKLTERQYLQTLVFDQEPIITPQGEKLRSIGGCVSDGESSPKEQHERIVGLYAKRGYQITHYLDFEEWDRMLDGIPGLEYFDPDRVLKKAIEEIPGVDDLVLTFEDKQQEFESYLRKQGKL